MMPRERKFHSTNKGFTLVELVVVIALMGVLLSIAGISIIGFQQEAERARLDQNAELMFHGAQSTLTNIESGGQLETYFDALKDDTGNYKPEYLVPVYNPLDGGFDRWTSTYITRTTMSSTVGGTSLPGTETMLKTNYDIWGTYGNNVLLSLRADAGDYNRYLEDPESVSPGAALLFTLIQSSISDTEILNGVLCVELAPADGQVFSAFYCNDATTFYYGNSTSVSNGKVDLSQRYYGARESKSLGYYGVETLTHVTAVAAGGFEVGELTVDNGNVLSYHLSMEEGTDVAKMKSLTYKISVYDAEQKTVALELAFKGNNLKKKSADFVADNLIDCEVTRFDANGTATNLGKFPLPVYLEDGDGTTTKDGIGFILDACDAAAMTSVLTTTSEATDIREGRSAGETFSDSLSFFRFGTWTELSTGTWTDMIYTTVTVTDPAGGEPGTAKSDTTSPYFASSEMKERKADGSRYIFKKDVTIENGRHLFNMRYFEDLEISTLGESDPTIKPEKRNASVLTFKLTQDIDWEAFAKEAYFCTSNGYDNTLVVKHNAAALGFPSFKYLRSTDKLTGFDETAGMEPSAMKDNLQLAHTISGVNVSLAQNMVYNLYSNYAADRDKPTGLFIENLGTIEHVAIDKSSFVGKNKVGSICGSNRGTLTYVGTRSTRDDDHPDPTIVKGIRYVGGVYGYQGSIGKPDYTLSRDRYELTVEYLTNNARVTGSQFVGGITGRVENGTAVRINDTGSDENYADHTPIKSVKIQYCENFGQVRGVIAPPEDGRELSELSEDELKAAKAQVRYIGGIVGYFTCKDDWTNTAYAGCRMKECYSYPIYDAKYDKDQLKLLAKLDNLHHDDITAEEQKDLLKLLQDYNVGNYVGGVIGYCGHCYIEKCGTLTDATNHTKAVNRAGTELTNGYIFGDSYVGGLIGANAGYVSNNTYNLLTVCGNDYVGGISGALSAIGYADKDGNPVTDQKVITSAHDLTLTFDGPNTNYKMVLTRYSINRGRIFGLYDYVGGIAGYTGGDCYGSYCDSGDGDHPVRISGRNIVGGLVGRNVAPNDHCLGKSTNIMDVDGENFVGGFIGYVGPTDHKTDYDILFKNGSVYGHNAFVGGVAGIVLGNTFVDDTRGYRVQAREITGRYFVGGTAGAIILNPEDDYRLKGSIENDNGLTISATAFAGGLYGMTHASVGSDDAREAWAASLAGTASMDRALTQDGGSGSLTAMVAKVQSEDASLGATTKKLILRQDGAYNKGISKVRLTSIGPVDKTGFEKELVYAAGFVGYNGSVSALNIENFNNTNNFKVDTITTTGIKQTESLFDPTSCSITEREITCAYTGNFVGVNTAPSTIDNCFGASTFVTGSDYLGGLCEVNRGSIINPRLKNNWAKLCLPSATVNYLGGLCGRNASGGTIVVPDNSVDKNTVDSGKVIGILTAENYGTIKIETAKFNQNSVTGEVVGIIAGRNLGAFEVASSDGTLTFSEKNDMFADSAAGAVFGEQYGDVTISNVTFNMKTGEGIKSSGAAGSIIGRILGGNVTISNCTYGNNDTRYCVKGEQAGGVVGVVELRGDGNVTIEGCKVIRPVVGDASDTAVAGGIVAVARRTEGATGTLKIKDCLVGTNAVNTQANNGDAYDTNPRTAGIIYDAGSCTEIEGCRSHAIGSRYGITSTKAQGMKNNMVVTNKVVTDTSTFGTVETVSADTMTNNYCIVGILTNVTGAEAMPADLKTAFAGAPVAVYTYKTSNSTYDLYGKYTTTEEVGGTTVTTEHLVNLGQTLEGCTGGNPADGSNFYKWYSKIPYTKVDEGLASYMQTHSVE